MKEGTGYFENILPDTLSNNIMNIKGLNDGTNNRKF
tara:strand:- start:348 stop:455 length:108 start_codon:yes stop_codon:yes gene_type:complete